MPHLEDMVKHFKGLVLERPGKVNLRTTEGRKAVKEAIEYVNKLLISPTQPDLEWSIELWKASRDHVMDHGLTSKTGHDGSDGSTPKQRVERYCNVLVTSGENIAYGMDNAFDILI